jgi:hypothetical protein
MGQTISTQEKMESLKIQVAAKFEELKTASSAASKVEDTGSPDFERLMVMKDVIDTELYELEHELNRLRIKSLKK